MIYSSGAAYIAQACQPCKQVSFHDVSRKLDDIADKVKKHLHLSDEKNPHPVQSLKEYPTGTNPDYFFLLFSFLAVDIVKLRSVLFYFIYYLLLFFYSIVTCTTFYVFLYLLLFF